MIGQSRLSVLLQTSAVISPKRLIHILWAAAAIMLTCGVFASVFAFDDPLATLFDIESFDSRITIHENAEVVVDETIVVNFKKPSDGFVRQLSVYASNSTETDIRTVFDHFEAHDAEGRELAVRISRNSSYTKIKIGDRGSSFSGRQLLHFRYRMQNTIEFASDRSELNLDITGIAWRAPIGRVQAVVEFKTSTLPTGLAAECATGSLGYETSDCRAEEFADSVVISSARALRQFEGLSLRVRWGNDIVTRPALWKRLIWKFELDSNWLWLVSIAPLILLFWRVRRIRRQFESGHGVAPVTQLQTFDGRRLSPAEAGLIFAERFDKRDIVATLFDLAARGALEIRVSGTTTNMDFKFKRLGRDSEVPSLFEQTLLEILEPTDGANETDITALAEALPGEMRSLRKLLEDPLIARGYLSSSPSQSRLGWALAAVGVGALVAVIGFYFTNLNLALVLVAAFLPAISVAGFGMKLTNKTARGFEAFHAINRFRTYLADSRRPSDSTELADQIGSQIGYVIALDAATEWPRMQGNPRKIKIAGLSERDRESWSPSAVLDLTDHCIAKLEGFQSDRCLELSDGGIS